MRHWLACVLVVATSGCPSVETDSETPAGPSVEFDPANSIVPFPNNLVLDPATGKVNLPMQPCETPIATQIRTKVLNTLDGFGTYEAAIQVTLTAAADPLTAMGSVVLFKRASGSTVIDPKSAQPVPLFVQPSTTLRFDPANCTQPAQVAALTIVPLQPLEQHSTYTVAVVAGLVSGMGDAFVPSPTWSLMRQAEDPVTLDDNGNIIAERTPLDPVKDADQLRGLDQLWKAHAPAMAFLEAAGHSRDTVLVAADFNTQTTTDPLDPAVANSPASGLFSTPLIGPNLMPGVVAVANLAGAPCSAGQGCTTFLNANVPNICNSLPCDAVGDVIAGGLVETNFQPLGPNPLALGAQIPGAWSDPVHPSSPNTMVLTAFAMVPNATAPANGWPVVVFGHGLGSSKESLIAIGPQLAKAGFASIAIDFQAHGSRAVQTSTDAAIGCFAGHCQMAPGTACVRDANCTTTGDRCIATPAPTSYPQCFAPFLSVDVAADRDNIRQTVLDLQRLIKAAGACGAANCASVNGGLPFSVDPTHIVYAGISLGGIIGSTTTAVAPALKASVLNVSGVGFLDIIENTQTLAIRCPLVNDLIDAGILVGQKWDPAMPTVGLCTTDAWKDPATQPGFAQFRATARWVLDPADGANFTRKLASKRFMIQEVVGDQVVPNVATDAEGKLVGLTAATADPMTPADAAMTIPPASKAIPLTMPSTLWLKYQTLPADAGMGFPGNTFAHASLLRPANANPDGALGTLRLQVDAITYLVVNK